MENHQIQTEKQEDKMKKVVETEEITEQSTLKNSPEVSKERVERIKKAFRSTWLVEQINSVEKDKQQKISK